MTIKNHDHYYDAPEEPEAVICEACGEEMEVRYEPPYNITKCNNAFCPNKYSGRTKEMAECIVELREEVEELKSKVKQLQRRLEKRDEN